MTTTIQSQTRLAPEIQAWIVAYLGRELKLQPEDIDVNAPFDRYGVDSMVAVLLTGDLQDWLGRRLDPTTLYDHPTIAALARYLAGGVA